MMASTNEPNPDRETAPIKFENKKVEVINVYQNTSQEIIEITTDKLLLVLSEYKRGFERQKEWQAPLGILVTIVLVLATTDFRKTWGMEPSFWQALFVMLAGMCLVWFVKAVYIACKNRKLSDVIDRIKRSP
jgi:hypothetical protein